MTHISMIFLFMFMCIYVYVYVFQKLKKRSAFIRDDETPFWAQVTEELMSDEEDILDGANRGKRLVKSLPWRGEELSNFVLEIDQRLDLSDAKFKMQRVHSDTRSTRVRPTKVYPDAFVVPE